MVEVTAASKKPLKRAPKKRASPLEDELARQFDEAKVQYEREYVALADQGRKFRWDFYVQPNLLIEVNGGIWLRRGGHSSPWGISRDYEKLNLATVAGYKSLLLTADHIKSGKALEWTIDTIMNEAFP